MQARVKAGWIDAAALAPTQAPSEEPVTETAPQN
jgi:hypothetical protein